MAAASARQTTQMDARIGANIRVKRNMRQISQEALAEAIGVSFQQLQKYERGANRVSASRLAQIAAALKTPIAWFYSGTDAAALALWGQTDDPGTLAALDAIADPAVFEAAARLKRLPAQPRRAILDVIDAACEALEGTAPSETGAERPQGRPAARSEARTDAAEAAEDRESEAA